MKLSTLCVSCSASSLRFKAESERVSVSLPLYRAFLRVLAHGQHQLVDLLVVFQGVPQGVLSVEQPLAEAVHLRVQGRGVQHGVPPVVR